MQASQSYLPTGAQGLSPREAGAQGFAPRDAGAQGFSPREAGAQGFSPRDVGAQGFSPREVGAQGFSPRDIGAQGFSPRAMAIGINSDETGAGSGAMPRMPTARVGTEMASSRRYFFRLLFCMVVLTDVSAALFNCVGRHCW